MTLACPICGFDRFNDAKSADMSTLADRGEAICPNCDLPVRLRAAGRGGGTA